MSGILDLVKEFPVRHAEAGEAVLEQGDASGVMLVMIDGDVEISRDGVTMATAAGPGLVFGDMAALLGGAHMATVRALVPSSFAVVENPRAFLEGSPQASLYVAELLARRLMLVSQYLVDVKRQYEGHDHLGMVDDVLGSLIHLQPAPARR